MEKSCTATNTNPKKSQANISTQLSMNLFGCVDFVIVVHLFVENEKRAS